MVNSILPSKTMNSLFHHSKVGIFTYARTPSPSPPGTLAAKAVGPQAFIAVAQAVRPVEGGREDGEQGVHASPPCDR